MLVTLCEIVEKAESDVVNCDTLTYVMNSLISKFGLSEIQNRVGGVFGILFTGTNIKSQ